MLKYDFTRKIQNTIYDYGFSSVHHTYFFTRLKGNNIANKQKPHQGATTSTISCWWEPTYYALTS